MSQHDPNVPLPRTAADALKLWDAGEPVPAFVAESEGASQNQLWEMVFAVLRHPKGRHRGDPTFTVSARETVVITQIVLAAEGHGYARMLQIQLSGGGTPVFVQKPKASAA